MFKRLAALLFLYILCQSLFAAVGDLGVKFSNGGKKEVDAGNNLNVLIMITNQSNTDKEFQIQLKNKGDGWKLITDYSSIRISKKSNLNKIIGIQVPYNFKAGDFTIELDALENPGKQSFGTVQVPIKVKPRYEIEVNKLKTPQYLFSGDTLSAFYAIQNLSNIDISVKATASERGISKSSILNIAKDSTFVYRYLITIPKDIKVYSQESVVLIAEITDKPESEKTIYNSFDVFPSKNAKFDRYNRFPIKIAGALVSSNRFGNQMSSSMYDIQGLGVIGEKNDKKIDFHLRGPDRSGNPLFGMNQEYYLKYSSPHIEFVAGDNSYSLSELTESSRNGRGIEMEYKLKNWAIGGYYNSPLYYPLINHIYSTHTSYTFNTKNVLFLGFISKTDTTNNSTNLVTVTASNSFFPWMSSDVELAFGQNKSKVTKAYKAAIQMHYSVIAASVNYTYAEPDFPGFFTNSLRLYSGCALTLKKLSISMNYGFNSSNMALDTLYSNAPFSKNLSFTTSYRLTPNNTVSIGGYTATIIDRSPKPLFDYSKYNGQLAIQSKKGPFSISLQGDLGKMQNKLSVDSTELSLFYNGTFSMKYDLSRFISSSIFTSYQGGQQKVTGFDQFYYGGMIMANLRDKFSVSVQYNSNYEWRFYTSDRSLFSLNMNGRINDRNEISLGANYNLVRNTLDSKEYNIQLRYTYTLNMPISKKKDVGSLTGKIINHGIDKVSGIRLSLNGLVTLTDKDGNFKFPSVPIGTYLLGTDASSFGLNAIPEVQGLNWVTIEPSKITHFEFAMTRSARIEGQVVVQEDERVGQKGYIPVKEQIEKLIIEATNGTEMFRIMTDRDGSFRFEDLRPGSWQVKVYPKGLPQGYQLITGQLNLNLASGKLEKIDIIVKKQARQIKFQKIPIKP